MFRPNGDQDRRNYSELLMPPEGYELECAVGTTYSLDLEALTAVAICLGLSEDTDSKLMQNPISMLNALQKVSDKILLFCEAGQIKVPGKMSALSILLEKIVVPVALPLDKKMKRYPAFHPKTWMLVYQNKAGQKRYRYVVLSRNLTFDRSWDISFAMDGNEAEEEQETAKPVADFLGFLRNQVDNRIPDYRRKRKRLSNLQKEFGKVCFDLDSKEFSDIVIMPMGIGKKFYRMAEDPLLCTDSSSADYTFHELVVVSPFLTGSVIEKWNDTERGLAGCTRTLITRRSELSKLKQSQVSNFQMYALRDEIIDGEGYLSEDNDRMKSQQDIHAKMYLRRKYSDVFLYLGSMNATVAAVNKNVEMMIRLQTKNRYLNAGSFLNDLFCGPADGEGNPFERVSVIPAENDTEKEENDYLEQEIKKLCRVPKKAVISQEGDKYHITISIPEQEKKEEITISPYNSNKKEYWSEQIEFHHMDLLQLSEFYVICGTKGNTTIQRIITIPTVGFPENREEAVVNSVVKDRNTFVEYIAFVLGDDYLISSLEGKEIHESGFFKNGSDAMPALYEKMLKTSLEAPEKMKEIDYVLKMITDKNIIPEEFRRTYATFCKTLKIR